MAQYVKNKKKVSFFFAQYKRIVLTLQSLWQL